MEESLTLELALEKIKGLENTIDYLQRKHCQSLSDLHLEIQQLQNKYNDLLIDSSQRKWDQDISADLFATLKDESERQKARNRELEKQNQELIKSMQNYDSWMAAIKPGDNAAKNGNPRKEEDDSEAFMEYTTKSMNSLQIGSSLQMASSKDVIFPPLSFKPSVFDNLKSGYGNTLSTVSSTNEPAPITLPGLHPTIGENAIKRTRRTKILHNLREKTSRFW